VARHRAWEGGGGAVCAPPRPPARPTATLPPRSTRSRRPPQPRQLSARARAPGVCTSQLRPCRAPDQPQQAGGRPRARQLLTHSCARTSRTLNPTRTQHCFQGEDWVRKEVAALACASWMSCVPLTQGRWAGGWQWIVTGQGRQALKLGVQEAAPGAGRSRCRPAPGRAAPSRCSPARGLPPIAQCHSQNQEGLLSVAL